MFLTASQNQLDNKTLSIAARYQTMVYVGKSLQSQGEHRRAEAMYKKALQLAKAITKNKSVKTTDIYKEDTSEIGL